MSPQIQGILDRLTREGFPYPVAIFGDQDFELGLILSVEAFDVPTEVILGVHEQLCDLLAPIETQPMMLPGAVHDFESAANRQSLPQDTVWYDPRRTHAQAH
jgi:hypothetical protein